MKLTRLPRPANFGPIHNYLLAGSVILLTLSFSTAVSAEGRIHFKHFSFAKPDSITWTVQAMDSGGALYFASRKKVNYFMALLENAVDRWPYESRTARAVADDYREHERHGMIELGVKEGLYELHDLTMGEEQIGENLFYTMQYRTKAGSNFQFAKLYLYFPNEEYVDVFLVVHFSASCTSKRKPSPRFQTEVLEILRSVKKETKND